jgi:Protein of unknown function (DUF1566)
VTVLTDIGNGALTDTGTGLMWQAEDDGVERNQEDAFIYCCELELAGYNDWRLPTLEEFETLASAARESAIQVNTTFSLATNRDYWTATQGPQADTAFIADGTTMFRTNQYLARAVRTSTYRPRPLTSPQWSADQLELAEMLKEWIQGTGRVQITDIGKKVSQLGPAAVPLFRRLLEVDLNGRTGAGVVTSLTGMEPLFALPIVGLALTSSTHGVRSPAVYYLERHPTRMAKAVARQALKNEEFEGFRDRLRSVVENEGA